MQSPATVDPETTLATLERLRSESDEISNLKELEDWNNEARVAIEAFERAEDPSLESLVQLKESVFRKWGNPKW